MHSSEQPHETVLKFLYKLSVIIKFKDIKVRRL